MSRTEPRVGPHTTASGAVTIWVRRINGRHLMFWVWPNEIAVYHIPDNHHPTLIRLFTKEK
jgi:hypothetical protein